VDDSSTGSSIFYPPSEKNAVIFGKNHTVAR
jgi:hypothetical protein